MWKTSQLYSSLNNESFKIVSQQPELLFVWWITNWFCLDTEEQAMERVTEIAWPFKKYWSPVCHHDSKDRNKIFVP